MKSTLSNAGSNSENGRLFFSHTIGQHSLINTFQNEGIQLLQGFEYHMISKTIEQLTKDNLYAYPNPSTGPITIYRKNVDHDSIRILIYDIRGALAKSLEYPSTSDRINIDLSNLSKGLYRVSLESGNKYLGNCQILLK